MDTSQTPHTPEEPISPLDVAQQVDDPRLVDTSTQRSDDPVQREHATQDEVDRYGAVLEVIGNHLDVIEEGVASQNQTLFRQAQIQNAREEQRSQQLNDLATQLRLLSQNLQLTILRPLIIDLVKLYREAISLERKADERRRGQVGDSARPAGMSSLTSEDLLDLLSNHAITIFEEPGEAFVPQTQLCRTFIDTDDVYLDQTIAKRISPGFRYGATVIEQERVAIYRAPAASQALDETPE